MTGEARPGIDDGIRVQRDALNAFVHQPVGEIRVVTPTPDNTLLDIARHFDVGYDEITNANPGMSVWTPGQGAQVVVLVSHLGLDVDRDGEAEPRVKPAGRVVRLDVEYDAGAVLFGLAWVAIGYGFDRYLTL